MTNQELQQYLQQFPADMQIRIMLDRKLRTVRELDFEHMLLTSETAYIDTTAPEEEWDAEDGKVELGAGRQYLLFNPIIY